MAGGNGCINHRLFFVVIRNTRLDVYAVGLWLHRDHGVAIHRGSFDAAYSYFAATRFSYGSTPGNWGTMSEFAKAHGFSLIPCAGPGYDDRRIRPWNTNAFRDRAGGKYYKDMFRAAIQTTTTGIVAITSWNEFGEGTNIEPCVPYTVRWMQARAAHTRASARTLTHNRRCCVALFVVVPVPRCRCHVVACPGARRGRFPPATATTVEPAGWCLVCCV